MPVSAIKIAAFSCLGLGAVLVLTSALIPSIESGRMISEAEQYSALTPQNEDRWASVPGPYSIGIEWNHFLYPLANVQQVSQTLQISFSRSFTTTSHPSSTQLALMFMTIPRHTPTRPTSKPTRWSAQSSTSKPATSVLTIRSTLRCGCRTKRPCRPGGCARIKRPGRHTCRCCIAW